MSHDMQRAANSVRRIAVVGLVLAGLAGADASAQAPLEARILRVEATTDVATVAAPMRSLGGQRLTKFMEDVYQVPRGVLLVDWRAPRTGLPGGAVVRLSYRLNDERAIRTKEVRYAPPLAGDRRTRFAVPLAPDGSDRISSWKVEVVHGGRALDQQASASWR